MQNDYTSKKFKKWLNKLQQESWQLELLVSAFVIYGLFQAYEPLNKMFLKFIKTVDDPFINVFIGIFGSVILLSVLILAFNLTIHLILRGLWIGAIGLRYYSGDVDFEELKYAIKFKKYLKKKIGSFDNYIGKLEDYCSIIFSLSFLLVFIILSFFIIISVFFSVVLLLGVFIQIDSLNKIAKIILVIFMFVYLFMTALTLIDFLFQGILKKNRIIATIYFPIYWIMSYLSLSFLYRPILYNFLDHKKGRRILFWIIPFYILLAAASVLNYNRSNFHFIGYKDSRDYILTDYYLDSYIEDSDIYFENIAIEKKRVTNKSLQIFLFHNKDLEDAIVFNNDKFKLEEDRRGLYSEIFSAFDRNQKYDKSLFSGYMISLNEKVIIEIDTMKVKSGFVASTFGNDQIGYESYIEISMLSPGKHYFRLTSEKVVNDSIVKDSFSPIPFWYYPE